MVSFSKNWKGHRAAYMYSRKHSKLLAKAVAEIEKIPASIMTEEEKTMLKEEARIKYRWDGSFIQSCKFTIWEIRTVIRLRGSSKYFNKNRLIYYF